MTEDAATLRDLADDHWYRDMPMLDEHGKVSGNMRVFHDCDRAALLDDNQRLRDALRDARIMLVQEHGHDTGEGQAPWPSCLPVHITLNRASDALAGPRP